MPPPHPPTHSISPSALQLTHCVGAWHHNDHRRAKLYRELHALQRKAANAKPAMSTTEVRLSATFPCSHQPT